MWDEFMQSDCNMNMCILQRLDVWKISKQACIIYIYIHIIYIIYIYMCYMYIDNYTSTQRFPIRLSDSRQSWNAAKRPLVSQRWSGSLKLRRLVLGVWSQKSLMDWDGWKLIGLVAMMNSIFMFVFSLQVPVFIHLQKKMTGWLDCWLAGCAIVPSLMCHAVKVCAGIQDESNDKVHPKTPIFFQRPLKEGSSFAMGFCWEFPEWESNQMPSCETWQTGQRDPRLPDSCCWTAIHFISTFSSTTAWLVIFLFLGLLFLVGNNCSMRPKFLEEFGMDMCLYIYTCIYIYMQIYFGFICN